MEGKMNCHQAMQILGFVRFVRRDTMSAVVVVAVTLSVLVLVVVENNGYIVPAG